jgi:hypothetical protein
MYNDTLIDQVCMTDFEDKRALLAEPLPSDIIVKILLKKIRSVTQGDPFAMFFIQWAALFQICNAHTRSFSAGTIWMRWVVGLVACPVWEKA